MIGSVLIRLVTVRLIIVLVGAGLVNIALISACQICLRLVGVGQIRVPLVRIATAQLVAETVIQVLVPGLLSRLRLEVAHREGADVVVQEESR